MLNNYWDDLKTFISIESIQGREDENQKAITFIVNKIQDIGFDVSIEGESQYFQPVVIAKLNNSNPKNRNIVLYNHYDVEKTGDHKTWDTPPFVLTEHYGRLFGRGVADNKAPLLARIYAIKQAQTKGVNLPNILWLIQGEEEVGSVLAPSIFPHHLSSFEAPFYLEETGYHRDEQRIYFQCHKTVEQKFIARLNHLNATVFKAKAKLEKRHLRKFGQCPFLASIPKGACYVAFGPNDYEVNIHQNNESISIELLSQYIDDFERFLGWV